jgi:type 1 glutamine amidotransferase
MRTLLLTCCLAAFPAFAEPPIPTLIVTGQNNHNWWYTSRVHQETLEATGRFAVSITEHPEVDFASPNFFSKVKVVVLDYNAADRWPPEAEKAFTDAVKAGMGVVAIHAADNAFPGWTDYEQMLGLMWVKNTTAHGKFHPFDVTYTDTSHPITAGLRDMKAHPDELYHNLVNKQNASPHLLAQAFSSTESGGTGKTEPMAFTLQFGQGRVFATPLGHVWKDSDATKPSVLDPQFRILLARGTEWAATGAVTLGPEWKDTRPHNTLSEGEAAVGWKLLFDGRSTSAWHAWKKDAFPATGWAAQDGTLHLTPNQHGGDIASNDEYADFELALDWKVAPGGNSGVMYRATEDHTYPWETGPECQILDNERHADGQKPKTRAGTLYDLVPCAQDVCRPAGEWNSVRIICLGSRIRHYLNGVLVVDIDTASDDYKKAHAQSKWPGMKDFNTRPKGHIALQDHGDEVWFRNIKIRELR